MTLRVANVSAGYGATTVLRDVSLTVPPRSVVALLGANGAGKTTLLRAASGLMPVSAGSVTLDGTELTGQRAHRFSAAGVCHIAEGRCVFPGLTVRENLALFARSTGDPDSIDKAIDAFPRLGERLRQVVGTMSGGEQQMLALSRAYVGDPEVILLDEVSMGLAPKVVDEIFEFLDKLVQSGASLLIVEQYVNLALGLAQYAYIIRRGRMAFAGESSELDDSDVFRAYLGGEVDSAQRAS